MDSQIPTTILQYAKSVVRDTESIKQIPNNSGSSRVYFRIYTTQNQHFIAAFSENKEENEAFFHFTQTFFDAGINVPKIIDIHKDRQMYLLSDLGNTTLFELISSHKTENLSPELLNLCYMAIDKLVDIQFIASKNIDYSFAYPIPNFDKTALLWDLYYFKYCTLKPADISFNELKLEQEFNHIIDIISENQKLTSFVYRDFQSRNIMIDDNNNLGFIDYQGGRKGLCLYDIASYTNQAKARFSQSDKKLMIERYYSKLSQHVDIKKDTFNKILDYTILHRALQTLGAYGFRGLIEKKQHFIDSLKPAIINLGIILKTITKYQDNSLNFTELKNIQSQLIQKYCQETQQDKLGSENLTVTINSFSYKQNSIPTDKDNGGGFVYDCRALPNPYRIEALRPLPGISQEIKSYMDSQQSANEFFKSVADITEISVQNYIERNFENLMISFGCTGGKHRSVYFAERLARFLKEKYNIKVNVNHLNKNNW